MHTIEMKVIYIGSYYKNTVFALTSDQGWQFRTHIPTCMAGGRCEGQGKNCRRRHRTDSTVRSRCSHSRALADSIRTDIGCEKRSETICVSVCMCMCGW